VEQLRDISKILVPVDYSEYSTLALRYALEIAGKAHAEINLFHAFYSPAYDLIELTGNQSTQIRLKEDITEKLMSQEEEKIHEFRDSFLTSKEYQKLIKKKLITTLTAGLAKDEIQRIARQYHPDLVVMGTRGSDKKQNSIFGSTTEIIIKKLTYPVLAIPENDSFTGVDNINRILFLTDFDESDFASIRKLIGFAELMGLSIRCLHLGNESDKWEELKMNGLKEYFRRLYPQVEVDCDILLAGDNMLASIDSYVKRNQINIISITTRKRNLLEKLLQPSLTIRLFYHTSVPLLVFHS
jgi:nucleotide-binding universal stress UspA family protein